MKKRNKRVALGTGIISLVICTFFAVKYRAYIQAWKKEQLKEAYIHQSMTEEDIAWG